MGRSAASSVLDAVRAARALDDRLGRRVVIAGHSQGGHAALWAAALAPRRAPELDVRGTVAFAPVSHLADQLPLATGVSSPRIRTALLMMVLRGIDVERPRLGVRALLAERAAALYRTISSRCLSELAAEGFASLAPSDVLRPRADLTALRDRLRANGPESLRISTPVRIEQGGDDGTVLPWTTDRLQRRLRAGGAEVTYRRRPGVSHAGIVGAGAPRQAGGWPRGCAPGSSDPTRVLPATPTRRATRSARP